jgi:hypothetical protein
VWEYVKIYTNQSNVLEGSTPKVEHKDKDQAAGLQIAESFILCEHKAYKMHNKSMAIFIHNDNRVEVISD